MGMVMIAAMAAGQPASAAEKTILRVAHDNGAFAFELYQALRAGDGNLFFSPYSISTAFAMMYGGARGETAQQIGKTLHFDLPQAEKKNSTFIILGRGKPGNFLAGGLEPGLGNLLLLIQQAAGDFWAGLAGKIEPRQEFLAQVALMQDGR